MFHAPYVIDVEVYKFNLRIKKFNLYVDQYSHIMLQEQPYWIVFLYYIGVVLCKAKHVLNLSYFFGIQQEMMGSQIMAVFGGITPNSWALKTQIKFIK